MEYNGGEFGSPLIKSKSVQKREAAQNKQEEIREAFFILFPFHSNVVNFDIERDCFIADSGTTPMQLVDIWNSRYQIFKKSYKAGQSSRNAEIEDLKKISPDHVSYLEEMSRLKQECDAEWTTSSHIG